MQVCIVHVCNRNNSTESLNISGISDASGARKIREEKELVYAKVVVDGLPTCLFLTSQRMRDFSGVSPDSIYDAIISAFLQYEVDLDIGGKDILRLTSFCADGAADNMVARKEAVARIKRGNIAILAPHCSGHKLEFAINDAFMDSKHFRQINDMMVSLYNFFRHSGKNWRMMMLLAQQMSVNILRYPKVHGQTAGLQNQQKYGLDVLMYNYFVFLMFAENAVHADQRGLVTAAMKTKIEEYLQKMTKYEMFAIISAYRDVLEETTLLCSKIGKDSSLITDIFDVLKDCSDNLNGIIEKQIKAPECPNFSVRQACGEPDCVVIKVTDSRLPENKRLSDQHIDNLNKKILVKTKQEFQLTDVKKSHGSVLIAGSDLVNSVQTCIQQRFSSLLQEKIIGSMVIIDHTRWDMEDKDYGIHQIDCLSDHFRDSLELYDYNVSHAKAEFIKLKKCYLQRYPSIKGQIQFWHKIFFFHGETFKNILYLAEICLSIAWAQETVKCGFNRIRRIMTHGRTSKLTNETINNMLILQLNLPLLEGFKAKGEYEKSVINRSVDKFMSSGEWTWTLKATTADDNEEPATKLARFSEESELEAFDLEDDEEDMYNCQTQDSSDEEDDDDDIVYD